jgi:thaumarchaeosortase
LLDIGKIGKHFIIPFSFLLAFSALYILNPNSFQTTWHGREPYLLFLWLFLLELILVWDKLHSKPFYLTRSKTAAIAILASIPIVYVLGTFIYGWNQEIVKLGEFAGIPYQKYPELPLLYDQWPISFEYLFFFGVFVVFVFVIYGLNGFKFFSISLVFIGAIGVFFTLDNFYPYDTIKLLQAMIPYTVSATEFVLNAAGYDVIYGDPRFPPNSIYFINIRARKAWGASMMWPCAGVQSLFVYSFVILLFLRNFSVYSQRKTIHVSFPKKLRFLSENRRVSPILKRRLVHDFIFGFSKVVVEIIRLVPFFLLFLVGAVGTFFTNVLRIATLGVIGANGDSEAAKRFHDYYGDLNFITWITVFPILMIFSSILWKKLYGET